MSALVDAHPGFPVDVILRDGSTLRLRAPARDDADALVAFFDRLSDESRYLRFHGIQRVGRALVEHCVDPDWADRGSLVGTLAGGDGEERIVALAEYARLRDPSTAEVAFTVANDLQGRGAATRLLEQLAARAARFGIEAFVAEVLPENGPMLAVFRDAGFAVSRTLGGGEIEVRFPIASTEQFRSRVEERDHVAVAASLRPFFAPAGVAVIGASKRRGSIGGELFRNILAADFDGAAYPVNRSGEAVAGVRAYRAIEEIPDAVDLAVICLPGEQVLAAAEAALRKGVPALCVISAGFAEIGSEGAQRQERLLALVRAHGARLVGPNCLGIAVPGRGLNATFAPRALPAGRIAFSSQSGALGLALLEKASGRGLGFSAFVSIGNKADVSSNDLLEWWEEDEGTDVVLLYLESFGNPQKFARVAGRVARRKPIVALKAGTSRVGARAASSHTAALAGSDTAVEALFRSAGVLRARNLEELVDVATLLSSQPLPKGRRVAVLTNAGGLGILCADACDTAGLELPALAPETQQALASVLPTEASVANPVDLLGSATGATYAATVPLLLRDPGIDAVIALFVPPVVAGADEVAAALRETLEREASDKPVLAVVVSAEGTPETLREAGSPAATFAYPESAARALGIAAERAEWLRRPTGAVPVVDGIDATAARRIVDTALAGADDVWLDTGQARALLTAYGVPVVRELLAADADGAIAAADALGRPVVVKTAVPGVHKTESGGVALDLGTDEEIRAAAERIGGPLLVQSMVRGGTELLAGVVQDPVFGPLVAFGPGGVFAELIDGAAFRIAPLTDQDADELVHTGKAGRLVRGFRGAEPADAAALVDLVQRLSALAAGLPEVAELDLNPVIASPSGCVAVDTRIRLRAVRPRGRSRAGSGGCGFPAGRLRAAPDATCARRDDPVAMYTSYGVVWREGESPLARGKLELLPRAVRLDGMTGAEPTTREIPYGDLSEIRIGRAPEDRIDGRQSLVLEPRTGATLSIASVAQAGVLAEIAERLTALQLGAGGRRRLAVVLPLKEESHRAVLGLLAGGPPFDPEALGLDRHEVYLTQGEAIFIFESKAGADALEPLLRDPELWQSAAAWHEHLAGPPTIAEDVFTWTRSAMRVDASLLPPGFRNGDSRH